MPAGVRRRAPTPTKTFVWWDIHYPTIVPKFQPNRFNITLKKPALDKQTDKQGSQL